MFCDHCKKRLIKIGETEHFELKLGYDEFGSYDLDGNYKASEILK